MSGMNSRNTKVFLYDQELARQKADGTSIPLNPVKSRTAKGWSNMAIKGGREQQEKGIQKNERTGARTREKKRVGTFHLYSSLRIPFLYHRNTFFFIYKHMIQLLIVYNYLLSLPIVDYPFPHFRNQLCWSKNFVKYSYLI